MQPDFEGLPGAGGIIGMYDSSGPQIYSTQPGLKQQPAIRSFMHLQPDLSPQGQTYEPRKDIVMLAVIISFEQSQGEGNFLQIASLYWHHAQLAVETQHPGFI